MVTKIKQSFFPTERRYYKEIGKRIAIARHRKNWSQQEVAERLGYIDRSTISRWENAAAEISLFDFLRVAWLLGIDLSYWIEGRELSERDQAAARNAWT